MAARRLTANRNWFVPIFDSLLFANESVFGVADTIAQFPGIVGVEDVVVWIELEVGINGGIKVFYTNGFESAKQADEGVVGARLLAFKNAGREVAVHHTNEFAGDDWDKAVLEEVFAVFKGNAGIGTVDFVPTDFGVAVFVEFQATILISELFPAETVKRETVDVHESLDIHIRYDVFEFFVAFAKSAADDAFPSANGVLIVLEEGARFGGLGDTIEVANEVLTIGADETVVSLSSEHGGEGGVVLLVAAGKGGGGNCTVVSAHDAVVVDTLGPFFVVIFRDIDVIFFAQNIFFLVGETATNRESVALSDWVANRDVVGEELFHIASVVGKNLLDDLAFVVGNIHVIDAMVFGFFGIAEAVVLLGGDFSSGVFVNGDELLPGAVLFAGFEIIVGIFDGFAVFVGFETIVVDMFAVKHHAAEVRLVDAKFVGNDAGFAAAALLNTGVFGDDLAHDGALAKVAEATSGAADEAVISFGIVVAIGASFEIFAKEIILVTLSNVGGEEFLGHGVEVGLGMFFVEFIGFDAVFIKFSAKMVAIFGNSVVQDILCGRGASVIVAGKFGVFGVAVGAEAEFWTAGDFVVAKAARNVG